MKKAKPKPAPKRTPLSKPAKGGGPRRRSHAYAHRPTPENITKALLRMLKPYGAASVKETEVALKGNRISYRIAILKADGKKLFSKVGAGATRLAASKELATDAMNWFRVRQKAVIDTWLDLQTIAHGGLDPAPPPPRRILRKGETAPAG